MALPRRIPKDPKRASRWRSQKHCNFVRQHACTNCGSTAGIEVCHVRIGSGAGTGQKPDDFRSVPMCGPCHRLQHTGERTFWSKYAKREGHTVEAVIDALCKDSPAAREIAQIRKEREYA